MRSPENFPFRGKFSEVYLHLNLELVSFDRKKISLVCSGGPKNRGGINVGEVVGRFSEY